MLNIDAIFGAQKIYIRMRISNHQGATKVSNIQRSLSQDRKEISILRLEQISKYQTEF